VFAASGFYKYFVDPIERVIISNNNQISFVNVPNATVYGVELEVRKKLGILAQTLRHFTANVNLALIDSNVDVPQRELEFAEGFNIPRTRPFQGQSPYVLNLGLAYDNYESGTSASLSFSRFGERVSAVAIGGAPNVFERPRNDLFFSVGQRVFTVLELKAAVDNVLNTDFVESQEYNDAEFVTRRYRRGRTIKLSVTYDL
jgi:outer membrane receptor protein involved in Fe transport